MKYLTMILSLLLVQGCAKSLEGDVYSRDEAQRTLQVQWATITATKPIVIEGDRSQSGKMAGGIIGGAAGYGVTDSSTRALTTAIGAVAGAIAGQIAEEKMTRAQGMEITLQLENGENIIIVQEVNDVNDFAAGDRVKLVSGSGKLHVTK
jgi:outer membrane lipoprotein SlyB